MCFSLEHQNPSKTSEKWVILIALQFRYTFYRPQTKRLRARKIGLQYKIRKACPFFTRHFVPRSLFGRRPFFTLRATFRAPARIWLAVDIIWSNLYSVDEQTKWILIVIDIWLKYRQNPSQNVAEILFLFYEFFISYKTISSKNYWRHSRRI